MGIGEMEQAKLVRAIDSRRQLQEVLVDFWGNHFNIDMKKAADRVLKVVDDREVIRPHIWGSFRDLLEASAKSPAMLFYLDNQQSSVARTVTPMEEMMTQKISDTMTENGNGAFAPPVKKAGQKAGGINENYGREIMELHTLGVDGGYTQKDVQEVARCFTGWSDRSSGYRRVCKFTGPGCTITAQRSCWAMRFPRVAGMKDGEMVLDILAAHPSTAQHIWRWNLCRALSSATIRPIGAG